MSLLNGTTALTICKFTKKLPEDFLTRLASLSIGSIADVKDEPKIGWAGYKHFEAPVDEANAICGGHILIQLVKAERKIPAPLLKNACRQQEIAYMAQVGIDHIPSAERKSIRADVVERTLMKMPPTVSSIPVAIDRTGTLCYIGSASQNAIDTAIAWLFKALELEAIPYQPNTLINGDFKFAKIEDLPGLQIAGQKSEDVTPGRDFLTWLWYLSDEKGGKIQDGEFELKVEGPLVFAADIEAKGAAESSVKKGGCPEIAAEAKAALSVGKKLKRCTLLIVHQKDVYKGSFDADKFVFTGLALPEGEELELHSRFEERMQKLETLSDAVSGYFKGYVNELADGGSTLHGRVKKWATDRESY